MSFFDGSERLNGPAEKSSLFGNGSLSERLADAQAADAASPVNEAGLPAHALQPTDRKLEKVPALRAVGLRKSFGRGKRRFEAVREVSLQLEPGEVLAFLGPNGAGKTTTIKMIAGLIRPDAGQVAIAGDDPHAQPAVLRRIGAVLEGNRNLYWRLTAQENLEYFGVLRQMSRRAAKQRGAWLLEAFGLTDKRSVPVQKLSRGMQQKIAIAVALIHEPQLLLLDEPTLGLDVEAGEMVKGLIRQVAASGCAILLTTHQLNVAQELADRVAIIRRGQIVTEQPTGELIAQFSSGSAYCITVDGQLDPARVAALTAQGASIETTPTGAQVRYRPALPSSGELYRILRILEPLPLRDLHQERADLTDIFLQLVRDHD